MFSNAALSRSQFCFDPLQNYRQDTLLSSDVCYWKSAKSVNNFRSKKRTAFEKNRLFGFQAGIGGPWFESRRGQKFFNLIFLVVFSNDSYYTKKIRYRKWLNILLTPWCSCCCCCCVQCYNKKRVNDWIYYLQLCLLVFYHHQVKMYAYCLPYQHWRMKLSKNLPAKILLEKPCFQLAKSRITANQKCKF